MCCAVQGNYNLLYFPKKKYFAFDQVCFDCFLYRLDMNKFGLAGIDSMDIPTTIRTQIPSFPDFNLRGFMGGFASKYIRHTTTEYFYYQLHFMHNVIICDNSFVFYSCVRLTSVLGRSICCKFPFLLGGYYGMLVPFYNADFNGRIARFRTIDPTLDSNLQELDLMGDRERRNVYKGYRGGFPSLWQAVAF